MRTLRFVTGNAGKVREAVAALAPFARVEQDEGGYVEVQADTLLQVARAGLDDVARRIAPPFFLEDAGLFVPYLGGFPGVYSAYVYKTIGCAGVLRLLHGVPYEERGARFESVVAFRDEAGRDHFFTGVSAGWIAPAAAGAGGFGFDPVFVPAAAEGGARGRTFAMMDVAEKNECSHRGRALARFRGFLEGGGTDPAKEFISLPD
jgi:XTP/dITP diphosphohydrolase